MDRLPDIKTIIIFLEGIREHPKMYFCIDDSPVVAQAYLSGTRFLALKLFDFQGSFVTLADETAKRRGYWYYADGIIPALERKGLNNKEIVSELIEMEIEFWQIFREKLIR